MAIEKMTAARFEQEVLQAKGAVLVEFSAPWCGYCRRLAPVLARMDGAAGTPPIALVDVDEEPQLAERYGVEVIPTLLLFQNGEHGERLIAPGSQAQVEAWLKKEQEA